jgi:putative flippase GtrA
MTSASSPLAALVERVRHLGPEATKFGIVGLTGVGVQIVAFNVLRYAGPQNVGVLEAKPITAQVLAIGLATLVTYLGNRHWTYRHRARGPVSRELPVFVLLNGIAIAIGAACLALSHYVLGLTSPLADNLSGNVIGLGLGTLFRFWSYRRFVFTGEVRAPLEDLASEAPDER